MKTTFSDLTCLFLAAGKGTRMKSALVKPLHKVAGRPMILHALAAAQSLNPARCTVVVGPGMENLAEAAWPCKVALQQEARGTGDAVRAGLGEVKSGVVLVLFGDTPLVTAETLCRLIDRSDQGDNPAVVVSGMTPPDPTGYGRLLVAGGTLLSIVEEKDATEAQKTIRLCNSGIMLFDGAILPRLLDMLDNNNAKGEYYLTDTIAAARKLGRVCAHVEIPYEDVLGVNTRVELAQVEHIMQQRLRRKAMLGGATLINPETVQLSWDTRLGEDVTVGPHVVFGPGVTVADRCEIRSFSHLEGATVGEGAIVGPFARLRPGTVVGPNCHVGNFVELKNAVMDEGAKANHLTYLGDAHVGARANIGAGTITCNYDGFAKHKTDIGAGAFIGSNTALVAPVTVGADALVGAGSVITKDVETDALAVVRGEAREVAVRGMAARRNKQENSQ